MGKRRLGGGRDFATRQAVADLIHHAARCAVPAGLAADDLRKLLADGLVLTGHAPPPLTDALQLLLAEPGPGFDLALCVDLADVLQGGAGLGMLDWVWEQSQDNLRAMPATLRAAVMNGFVRAHEAGLILLDTGPSAADCLTRPAADILPGLRQIACSMDADTRAQVAGRVQGDLAQTHFDALNRVLDEQGGRMTHDQIWYPGEALEMCAYEATSSAFNSCTAILLVDVLQRGDRLGWFAARRELHAQVYCGLPDAVRWPILAAIRWIYEGPGLDANGATVMLPVV